MINRREITPEKIVGACVIGLIFFVVLPYFNDGRRNTRRARELVTRLCAEDDACVEKAQSRLQPCVDASSWRSAKHTISFDEERFSVCIRAHLGLDHR